MRDIEGQAPARARRCANHPAVPGVASCQVCGRALCIACVVLVRGATVGPECLPSVLEGAPAVEQAPIAVSRTGDAVSLAGFALVLILSVFPWSRFGGSRYFDAWTPSWSLLAVLAALAGVAFLLAARGRPLDPRVDALVDCTLGVLIAIGTILHRSHPPPLTAASTLSLLALIGAGLAIVGGVMQERAAVTVGARRSY